MESQDHNKINHSSGHHQQGHGVHICHKCGWPFPNPHPSARHRRAHRKICGTIQGFELGDKQHNPVDDDDEHLSHVEHSKAASHSKATSQESSKMISITRRTSSGFTSRSSTRSEEDVFSDAVMDFTEGSVVEDCAQGTTDLESTLDIVTLVADGGKLCSENTSPGTQLQAADQYPDTEIDTLKNDNSSECLRSSMNEPVSSDLGAGGDNGEVAAFSSAHYVNEMGSKEQGAAEASVELATSFTANADNIKNTVRDSLGDPLVHETERQIGLGTKDAPCPEIGPVQEINTMESEAVNEANLEQGACIRLNGEDSSSPKEGVCADDVPNDSSSKEQPEIMPDNVVDQRAGKFTVSSSPDYSAVKILEQDEDRTFNEVPFVASTATTPDSGAEMSKDVICNIDSREVTSAEAAVKEPLGEVITNVTNATDTDIPAESEVPTSHQCLDHEQDFQGKKFEYSEEGKPLTICDDSVETDKADRSGEVFNAVHDDRDNDSKDFQFYDPEKNEQSQEAKSSEEKIPLVLWEETLQNDDAIQASEAVETVPDTDNCDEMESQYCEEAAEDDKKLLGPDKAFPQLTDLVASEVVSEEGNCSAKSYDSEFGFLHNKVEAEKSYSYDQQGTDPSSTIEFHESEMVKTAFQSKKLQDVQEGDPTRRDVTVAKEGNEPTEICAVDNECGVVQEVKNVEVTKVSDLAGVQLSNVNGDSSLENSGGVQKNPAASLGAANETQKSDGNGFSGKVDLGLISDHDDDTDSIKNTAKEVLQSEGDSAPSFQDPAATENKVPKEVEATKTVNDSVRTQGDMNLVKHDDIVSALDYQADTSSQTDSLEGNWGSVSVLSSFSDVPPATDLAPPPSQTPVQQVKDNLQPRAEAKAGCDGSHLSGLEDVKEERNDQKDGVSEVESLEKPQELVDDSLGRKRNEEIIAKVTNWSSGKQHSGKQYMPLKSLLGEPDDFPTTVSADSPPAKTDKENHGNQKSQTGEEASRGVGKEWNSPARYPANIKREKTKVRSRPYWAPFICCSSIETS